MEQNLDLNDINARNKTFGVEATFIDWAVKRLWLAFSEKLVCTILCQPKSRALKTFFLWLVMATFQYGKMAILLYGNNRVHTDRVFNVTKASLLEITQNYIRFNPRNWETWRGSLRILDSSGGRSLLLTPLYLWVIVMMIWFWSCLPFYFLIKSYLLLSNLIQSMLTDRILCVLTWRPFRILSSSSLLPAILIVFHTC